MKWCRTTSRVEGRRIRFRRNLGSGSAKLLLEHLFLVFGRLPALIGDDALGRRQPGPFASAAPRFLPHAVLLLGFLLGQGVNRRRERYAGNGGSVWESNPHIPPRKLLNPLPRNTLFGRTWAQYLRHFFNRITLRFADDVRIDLQRDTRVRMP